jgi:hypothetical protein
MPEFKPTGGPWGIVVEFDRGSPDYKGQGHAYIVTEDADKDGFHTTIAQIGSFGEFHEAVANGNLMAAAPEMFQVLTIVKEVIESQETLMEIEPTCQDLAVTIGHVLQLAAPDANNQFGRWHPGGNASKNKNHGSLPPLILDEDGEIKI